MSTQTTALRHDPDIEMIFSSITINSAYSREYDIMSPSAVLFAPPSPPKMFADISGNFDSGSGLDFHCPKLAFF